MTGHPDPIFFRVATPAAVADVVSMFPAAPANAPRNAPRVALIGTFAPRKCGIATFTSDVFEQLGAYHPDIGIDVYALDDADAPMAYQGIAGTIRQQCLDDYLLAARQINESGVDAVWLQHEYGIFGGPEGEQVCALVDRIAAPLIVTLHTVLSEPCERQRAILNHLLRRASRVMVMSQHGRELLLSHYDARPEVVTVIPHGAPDRPFGRGEHFKRAQGLGGRNVLMTFGLLGPGKGLELAIEALPAIVARHPDTIYRIVGATHPNLVARDGESYREGLIAQAERLGVADHIVWENRFLETDELLDQLEACDIYLTPYHNLQQATSGTLSYAVALGKAVVSTPYVHARELLAGGVGALIERGCSGAIAETVIGLLDDRDALARMQRRAYAKGRTTIWRCFADASAELIASAVAPAPADVALTATPGLSGFLAMCDATGMLQHAIGLVPDRRHGYCLDDNARALMLVNCASGIHPTERLRWQAVFAAFIQHAWNADARRFRNFMNFDRTWCEDTGSEDSNGRALWALGQTVETASDEGFRRWALELFDTAAPALSTLGSPRAVAFAMLGAAAIERASPGRQSVKVVLEKGGDLLHSLLVASRRPDWAWFETVLGYDNPRLSQALIEAGDVLDRRDWIEAGLESLRWISSQQVSPSGNFRPVGSESFGHEYAHLPFDQQPLESQAAIEACAAAWRSGGNDPQWLEHALAAYRWYFGANDRGAVLADIATGRCRDGVTPRGRNENCGAESILAFQLAHYSMLALLADEADSTGAALEPGQRTTG
jgi:glycosyltransferase involved in cell wall biosynthesis